MTRGGPRAVALCAAALLAAAGCGGGASLAETLPTDGELGAGWVRASEVRTEAAGEASTLCGVTLNQGMTEGAKVELTDDDGDLVSTFYRRYESADAATAALDGAALRVGECSQALGDGLTAVARDASVDDAGDGSSAAYFSVRAPGGGLAGEFGWSLVRVGDVVRSTQYTPASPGSAALAEFRSVTRALGAP